MHFDEIYQNKIGLGTVQKFTVFCCFLIGFIEGFLSTGIWFLTPYLASDNQLEWYQQSQLYLPFLISHILGHIVLGGVSDVSGRRSTLKGSCVTCYVASVLAAVSPALVVYQISSVAYGFSLAGIHSGTRILIFETLPMSHRGAYVITIDIIAYIGSIVALAWEYFLMRSDFNMGFLKPWQLFFFFAAIISVIGSCLVGLMPFSIRQMLCHQRSVSVNIMLRKFHALNKQEHESSYSNEAYDPFMFVETRHYRREQCSDYFIFHFYCVGSYIWNLFTMPFFISSMFLGLLHMCFFESTPFLNTFLSERITNKDCVYINQPSPKNSTLIDNDQNFPHVENYYMMLSSLFAAILLFFVADRCKRNKLSAFSSAFASIFSFALVHRFQYSLELPIALTFMFFHTSTSLILNVLTFETYPTKFRGTAYGVLKGFSNFGVLLLTIIYSKSCFDLFTIFYYAVIAFILAATVATSYSDRSRKPIME